MENTMRLKGRPMVRMKRTPEVSALRQNRWNRLAWTLAGGILWLLVVLPVSAQAQAGSPAEESVWITLGQDAFEALLDEPSIAFESFPLKKEGERSGVVMTQVYRRDLLKISERLHQQFNRCSGFMTHGDQSSAKLALEGKIRRHEDFAAVNYVIDQEALVDQVVAEIRANRIMGTIETLSQEFPNRFYLHPSGVNAAIWIRNLWRDYAEDRPDVTVELFNHPGWSQSSVILTIPGSTHPEEVVVLGGHLDSIAGGSANPNFSAPGADDNASGIAALSEVIRAAMETGFVPQRTIQFMGYAAEEVGLLGSQEIAAAFDRDNVNVVGALQLDMTAYNGSAEDFALISDFTDSALTSFVGDLIDTYQPNLLWTQSACGYACSDHASWFREGYPSAFAFEARFNQNNPFIHTPSDTMAVFNNTANHAIKFSRLAAAFMVELGVDGTPPPPPSPPTSPSDLVATGQAHAIRLQWIDNSTDATKFRIERALPGQTFEDIGSVPGNQVTFLDEDLPAETTYVYQVRAKNPYGFSSYSNVAQGTTLGESPSPPSNPTVEALSSGSVRLHWTDAPNDLGYEFESRAVGTWSDSGFDYQLGPWTKNGTAPKDSSSWDLEGLQGQTTYEFRIRSLGTAEPSEPSPMVRTTTWSDQVLGCPDGGPLCLLNDQYRIDVAWHVIQSGETGTGSPVSDSDNTGLFWFFNPDNIELVVKVLDGEIVNGSRWFFYGALSDVEYWIRVTETASGRTRTYYNPSGNLCGSGDVGAFPTLEGLSAEVVGSSKVQSSRRPLENQPLIGGSCQASESTLCLLEDRFAVSVDWKVPASGQEGMGTAVPDSGNDQSGFFYFFNPDNLELVVKVLDGRTINGSFWVFYGALSDVEYHLTVEDTLGGGRVTYLNENGNLCGRGDVSAFPE